MRRSRHPGVPGLSLDDPGIFGALPEEASYADLTRRVSRARRRTRGGTDSKRRKNSGVATFLAAARQGAQDRAMADAPRTTLLLRRLADGQPEAADELLPLLYDELHGLARGCRVWCRRSPSM